MLNHSELAGLLSAMRASRVTSLEIENDRQRLRLVLPSFDKPSTPMSALLQPIEVLPKAEQIGAKSPTIGTFLQRGIDDGLPVLKSGTHVEKGEVLGYVCHGPARVIVDAPCSGVLMGEGPGDGTVLGLGDTVFNLEVTP